MTTIAATDLTSQVATQTVLADRFILTQVERFTLVFPAVWVAEILRLDRSQILDLPFYDPLMVGIINHNGRITPGGSRSVTSGRKFYPPRTIAGGQTKSNSRIASKYRLNRRSSDLQ
jgi:hypothetical protein